MLPRWLSRLKARLSLRNHLRIWYHDGYEPPSLVAYGRELDIPMDRGRRIATSLLSEGLIKRKDIIRPKPVSFSDLLLLHTSTYLESTASRATLARIFGTPEEKVKVEELLSAQRLATGGTLAAARAVVRESLLIGVNLGGGFHHADRDRGEGLCIYNDIAVAIARLQRDGFDESIAIVDLDYHQGNGNLSVFAEDPKVLTYSIHGSVWKEMKTRANHEILLPSGISDERYLSCLRLTLTATLQAHAPKLVFYIAGNDVLKGDHMGEFALSTQGVFDRDRFAIEECLRLGAGVVVVLGGGYHEDAWLCSARLLRWLLTGEVVAPLEKEPQLRQEFNRIASEIDPLELRMPYETPFSFNEIDILGDLTNQATETRILDYYSRQGVEFAFERYGILGKLRKIGFQDLKVKIDPSNPARQLVRIYGGKEGMTGGDLLLLELLVRKASLEAELSPVREHTPELPLGLEFLSVEWLLLQDPTAAFTQQKPRLPGQEFPGLGISEEVQELLVQACRRVGLDGLLNQPAHFHNAAVAARNFRFLDPLDEGRFRAVRQTLATLPLAEATAIVEDGRLLLRDGTPYRWQTGWQVLPVSSRLKKYFDSASYRSRSAIEYQTFLNVLERS